MSRRSPDPDAGMQLSAADTISGPVERVIFRNPETGYAVVRLRAETGAGPATVVGVLPELRPGRDPPRSRRLAGRPHLGAAVRRGCRRCPPADHDRGRRELSRIGPGRRPGPGAREAPRPTVRDRADAGDRGGASDASARYRGSAPSSLSESSMPGEPSATCATFFFFSRATAWALAAPAASSMPTAAARWDVSRPIPMHWHAMSTASDSIRPTRWQRGSAFLPIAPIRLVAALEHAVREAADEGHSALPTSQPP